MESAADPRSRGLFSALRSLLARPQFEPLDPTHAAERYCDEPRRGVAPLVDVYLPEGAEGPHPSVLLVHGGGFLIGHRAMKPVSFLAGELCRAGFAVASVDYRLIFRGGRLDAAVADIATAAAWWRAEHERFGVDPQRIAVAGLSAGATLAMLYASQPEAIASRLVSIYGLYELDRLQGRGAALMRRWAVRSRDPEVWAARSPANQAPPRVPTLLLHGDQDRLVPLTQAERLLANRRSAGVPIELHVYEGEDHGFLNHAERPATQALVGDVIDFLRG